MQWRRLAGRLGGRTGPFSRAYGGAAQPAPGLPFFFFFFFFFLPPSQPSCRRFAIFRLPKKKLQRWPVAPTCLRPSIGFGRGIVQENLWVAGRKEHSMPLPPSGGVITATNWDLGHGHGNHLLLPHTFAALACTIVRALTAAFPGRRLLPAGRALLAYLALPRHTYHTYRGTGRLPLTGLASLCAVLRAKDILQGRRCLYPPHPFTAPPAPFPGALRLHRLPHHRGHCLSALCHLCDCCLMGSWPTPSHFPRCWPATHLPLPPPSRTPANPLPPPPTTPGTHCCLLPLPCQWWLTHTLAGWDRHTQH